MVAVPSPGGRTRRPSEEFVHLFERSIDLLLDPRLPQAAPYTLWRRWRYSPPACATASDPVRICLTFDIEHDFRRPATAGSSARFLPRYLGWMQRRGWRGTLYIQGDLVPSLGDLLHQAGEQHELGLHGLHHEVWGRSRWWQYRLGLPGLPVAERRRRLDRALDLFDRADLQPPRSFRAPYLNADRHTLKLLRERGFTSDSSPASYLGAIPVPRQSDGLWRIPVTAHPRPEWHRRGARYHELTLAAMSSMSDAEIMATVSIAVDLQRRRGSPMPPHVVLLAHPWEFELTAGVSYASEANWDRLARIVETIGAAFPPRAITVSDLVTTVSRPSSTGSRR